MEVKKYDYIFMNYVLEHVINPIDILRKYKNMLKLNGYIFITVPNATALSRVVGKRMNVIKDIYQLTDNDKRHGHRRVYDIEKITDDILNSELKIIDLQGLYIKPLSDFQLNKALKEKIISEEYLYALADLGTKHTELSGSICIVAQIQ